MSTTTTTASAATGHQLLSSEDLEDTPVFGADGEQLGTIDHLMVHKVSGQVNYVVIKYGGVLGLGHSHYPVPWRALRYDYGKEGYLTNIRETMLRDAPEFSDDSWSDSSWQWRVHSHYGVEPYY